MPDDNYFTRSIRSDLCSHNDRVLKKLQLFSITCTETQQIVQILNNNIWRRAPEDKYVDK